MRSRMSGVMACILSGAIGNPAAWTIGSRRALRSSIESPRMCSALSQRALGSKVSSGVGAIDAFEREGIGEFLQGHLVAIVFWRPAEQAQKVDEGLRKEASIAVSGDADYGTVAALRELRSVGRDQQRKMRELRRLNAGRLPSRGKDQDM